MEYIRNGPVRYLAMTCAAICAPFVIPWADRHLSPKFLRVLRFFFVDLPSLLLSIVGMGIRYVLISTLVVIVLTQLFQFIFQWYDTRYGLLNSTIVQAFLNAVKVFIIDAFAAPLGSFLGDSYYNIMTSENLFNTTHKAWRLFCNLTLLDC